MSKKRENSWIEMCTVVLPRTIFASTLPNFELGPKRFNSSRGVSVTGRKKLNSIFLDSIAQDICNIKQTPSCSILQLCYFQIAQDIPFIKKNPNLSFFKLRNVFGDHNDNVGRGSTLIKKFSIQIHYVR